MTQMLKDNANVHLICAILGNGSARMQTTYVGNAA